MKVTGQDPAKTAELTLAKNKGKGQAPPAAKERPTREPAQVQTRASLTLDRVKEAIRKEADVRLERVAELRERIRGGEYRVDADKLADKILIDSLREDLDKP